MHQDSPPAVRRGVKEQAKVVLIDRGILGTGKELQSRIKNTGLVVLEPGVVL